MESRRILLISPPFYRLMGSHFDGIHLGLAYIAAVLAEAGYEVRIYNADFYDSKKYLDQRQIFESFESYKSILDDLSHPIWQEIEENIREYSPEIVGIQMYTGTYKSARNVATIIKEIDPKITIVTGGTHPTVDPIGTLKGGPYDYVIRGEGEYTFLELLSGINIESIRGLSYRKNGGFVNNPDREFISDLDVLPFPARNLFLTCNDKIDKRAVITSRGCPFQCTYCVSPKIWQRKVRYRSVENVLNELEYLNSEHNLSLIRFHDDTFTLNKKRVTAVCKGIVERGLKFQWVCDTRVDTVDSETLKLMKESGCIRVKIGVESGSERILNQTKKGITKQQIRRAVSLIKDVGIPITIYLMIGFPGETNEDVKETIRFAREIDADYNSLSIVAPYYGTRIYNELESNGFKFDKDHWEYFYHQSRAMIMNTEIDPLLIDEFLSLNNEGKGGRV